MTAAIDPNQPAPPPADPLRPKKSFVSARTQLEQSYLEFKSPELPLVERVRAGHQFVDLGLRYVPRGKETEEFTGAMRSFRQGYVAPRFTTSIVQNSDGVPVLRVNIGGQSDATSDFPVVMMGDGLRAVQDMMYENYYNTKLSKAVASMVEMLTRHGILRREPMEFRPRFDFLSVTKGTADDR